MQVAKKSFSNMGIAGLFPAAGRSLSVLSTAFAVAALAAASASATDWSGYERHFNVSFPGYTGGTELTNFPVLVRLSSSLNDFDYSKCKAANGGDLRFSDDDGNLIPSEIDTWNPSGTSLVWVKVPTLTRGTRLTAYYGWAFAPYVDAKAVWDAHYLGVWHLGASGSETVQRDSTANGKDFTVNTNYSDGVAVGAGGVAGYAAASGLRTDGKGCFGHSDQSFFFSSFSALTMEIWAYQDDHDPGAQSDNRRYMLSHSSNAASDWQIYETKSGKHALRFEKFNGSSVSKALYSTDSAAKPLRAAWNYTAFSWNGSDGALGLYLNGDALAITADAGSASSWVGQISPSLVTGFWLGNYRYENSSGNKPFIGSIDEVRISDIVRSAAWVKATHDTIRPGSGFATLSAAVGNESETCIIIR